MHVYLGLFQKNYYMCKSTLSIHEDLGYCVEKFEVIFNGFILPKDEIMNKKLFFENLDLSDKDFNIIFVWKICSPKGP